MHPPRLFNCARCARQVRICSHCDRGQIYCAGDCARQARQASLREAGRRYQESRQGRRLHAARQAHYRQRQREKVTHQGSANNPRHDSLLAWFKRRSEGTRSRAIVPDRGTHRVPRCDFCGQPCSSLIRLTWLSGGYAGSG